MNISAILASVLLCLTLASAASAQREINAENLTDEHVRHAIGAMVEELYRLKQPKRCWDPRPWRDQAHGSKSQVGGYTALAVLALLHAGESYQNPRLIDAVEYLAKYEMEGTYAVALRASIWAKLPAKFRQNLADDAQWLLDGFSEEVGGWTYDQTPYTTREDNSINQYGALALWEAAKRGVRIEPRVWQLLERGFMERQLPDGGWHYKAEAGATGSMTTAGLATLFITQDFLHAQESVSLNGKRDAANQQAIDRGLAWMNEHYSPSRNPGSATDFYYYSYGVERVGLASGVKHFAGRDWYRQGAAEIISKLCRWDETTRTMTVRPQGQRLDTTQTKDVCFALLFLSRGRVPVAINKLQAPGVAWNNRPRDAANLTAWIRDATETDLNWQIVSIDAEPEEWLDAPVLYFASDQSLPWVNWSAADARQVRQRMQQFERDRASGAIPMDSAPPFVAQSQPVERLKRYLDLGGLLFAVNEGRGRGFADSIKTLGELLYPQYEWRPLPDDHWVYTIHFKVRGRKPSLMGLSNGVRELMILSPGMDLAGTWQAQQTSNEAHFQTGANVYFYASELNRPRPRLAQHAYEGRDDAGNSGRNVTAIVHAAHEANWNAEPAALPLLADFLSAERGLSVQVVQHPLHEVAQLDARPALTVVSGTGSHRFSDEQRRAIRAFVQGGGVILFETPGGDGSFTLAAERMAVELFGQPIRPLFRHPLITGDVAAGAANLRGVEYRPFSFELFGTRELRPRLRGMEIDGEVRLLFSREDLSHALLDQPRWGISGYRPASARQLAGNIIQHAVKARGNSPDFGDVRE